jgi:hypothetical protein
VRADAIPRHILSRDATVKRIRFPLISPGSTSLHCRLCAIEGKTTAVPQMRRLKAPALSGASAESRYARLASPLSVGHPQRLCLPNLFKMLRLSRAAPIEISSNAGTQDGPGPPDSSPSFVQNGSHLPPCEGTWKAQRRTVQARGSSDRGSLRGKEFLFEREPSDPGPGTLSSHRGVLTSPLCIGEMSDRFRQPDGPWSS